MSSYGSFSFQLSSSSRSSDLDTTDLLTEEDEADICKAFTLLDEDGDGVIDVPVLEELLITWGRLPFDEELITIMSFAGDEGCEGKNGMNLESFRRYLITQFIGTNNEEDLKQAFRVFDTDPPTGKVNLVELRHSLKNTGIKLTDDEIDFLFREEDFWMLEERNTFEYEELINKILNKPITSRFLLY